MRSVAMRGVAMRGVMSSRNARNGFAKNRELASGGESRHNCSQNKVGCGTSITIHQHLHRRTIAGAQWYVTIGALFPNETDACTAVAARPTEVADHGLIKLQ